MLTISSSEDSVSLSPSTCFSPTRELPASFPFLRPSCPVQLKFLAGRETHKYESSRVCLQDRRCFESLLFCLLGLAPVHSLFVHVSDKTLVALLVQRICGRGRGEWRWRDLGISRTPPGALTGGKSQRLVPGKQTRMMKNENRPKMVYPKAQQIK